MLETKSSFIILFKTIKIETGQMQARDSMTPSEDPSAIRALLAKEEVQSQIHQKMREDANLQISELEDKISKKEDDISNLQKKRSEKDADWQSRIKEDREVRAGFKNEEAKEAC